MFSEVSLLPLDVRFWSALLRVRHDGGLYRNERLSLSCWSKSSTT